jgi:hypothetical protein
LHPYIAVSLENPETLTCGHPKAAPILQGLNFNVMKQKLALLTALISLSIITIFWYSCAKKKNPEICSICQPVLPKLTNNVTVAQKAFKLSIYEKSPHPNFVISTIAYATSNDATSLNDLVKQITPTGEYLDLLNQSLTPIGFSVYLHGDVRTHPIFDLNDIAGISVYLYTANELHHFLFAKSQSGSFELNKQLAVTSDAVNFVDQALIFDKVINRNMSQDTFSLVSTVVPPFNDVFKKIRSKGELYKVLKRSGIATGGIQLLKVFPGDADSDRCDPHVCLPIADKSSHCVQLIGGYGCNEKEDPCPLRAISNGVSHFTDYLKMTDTLYMFRDSVLAKSTHGDSIINNYYLAGSYLAQHLGDVNLSKLYGYITLLYSKLTFMINNPSSTTILIDSSTRDDMLDAINDLRSLSRDSTWLTCLDWMASIIQRYSNSSSATVYNYVTS